MKRQEGESENAVHRLETVQLDSLVVVDVGPLLLRDRKHGLLMEPPANE